MVEALGRTPETVARPTDRIRFNDGSLDDIAAVIVGRFPVAVDYLAQAPIIAALAAKRYRTHITYGELDHIVAALALRPKLKVLLRALGVPVQLRALHASAIKLRDHQVMAALAKLDPSTLAQIIPTDSQRIWLDACSQVVPVGRPRKGKSSISVAWLGRHLTEDMSRYEQVGALVDFVQRGDGEFSAAWSWQAALSNVEAWHRSLNDQRRIAQMVADDRRRANFDKVICRAPLPDQADLNGYTFTALRTPRALHQEGVAMHHCVASYADAVARGRTAVVSIKRDGVHVATLEVDAKGRPAQLKTHCNGIPSAEAWAAADIYVLTCWQPEAGERKAA